MHIKSHTQREREKDRGEREERTIKDVIDVKE